MTAPKEVEGFARVDGPWPWPVYRDGAGPPVVLIHELDGLTPAVIAYARSLADAGFTVYLPVLVGPLPADTKPKQYLAAARICVSREIHVLRTGRTSPVVMPLRRLAQYATKQAGTKGCGVVGMCFSGGFAMALAADEPVLAGVAAQPSLPFATPLTPWCARDLGLSSEDKEALHDRLLAGETHLYVTRFSHDPISPYRRQQEIEQQLGVTVDAVPSGEGNAFGFTRKDHSVLSYAPTQHKTGLAAARLAQTAADVAAFLHGWLDTPA